MVLPGWGQLATDHRFAGWSLIGITMVLTAVGVALLGTLGPLEVLAVVANPDVLIVLVALNLALAGARLAVTLHAWREGGGRAFGGLLLLVALTLTPHALVTWVGVETRATLVSVFAPEPLPPAPPVAASTTIPGTTSPSTTAPPVTVSTVLGPVPVTPLTPDLKPPVAPERQVEPLPERLNLLLLGGDAGPRRSGIRTDTMIVASIDTASGNTALFGIPRNYGGIVFSDGTSFPGSILNEVYQWGSRRPDRFGSDDPGAAAIVDVIENMTGLTIDHHVLVDLTGFGAVVDAFGGVAINVPLAVDGPLYDPETGSYRMVTIGRGEQLLDGDHALAYARSRLGTSDYDRMRRQRCLLVAMADQADPVRLLARLPTLLEVIETHIRTDLPLDMLGELIRVAPRVAAAEVRVVGFGPGWSRGVTSDGYRIPDIEKIRATVDQTLNSPEAPEGTATATEGC